MNKEQAVKMAYTAFYSWQNLGNFFEFAILKDTLYDN